MDKIQYSVVSPVFNEENGLNEFYRRLSIALQALTPSYEIIFVDDGSSDRSFEVLSRLFDEDPGHVHVLRLSRNFGHHIALTAGLDRAKGEFIICMDSDLQDLPEEIAHLASKISEGYDCVYAIRKDPQFNFFRKISSKLFVKIMNWLLRGDFTVNTSVFRIFNRRFLKAFNSMREQNRFVLGMMSWIGFKQVGLQVNHGKRFAGETKYDFWKLAKLSFNSITSFSLLPLQVASLLGISVSIFSGVAILVILFKWIFVGVSVVGWTSVITAILFMGGIQLMAIGLIGEYIGRSFLEQKARPLYILSDDLSKEGTSEMDLNLDMTSSPRAL